MKLGNKNQNSLIYFEKRLEFKEVAGKMVYLDNASTSFPKPDKVYEEVVTCMKEYGANAGRGSYDMAVKAATKVSECRQEISELFNIKSPLNIIFTTNATQALNIAIKGVLKKRDHVITTVIEHNSVLRPLDYLSKRGIEVTFLGVNRYGGIDLTSLKKELRRNTKAIIINHVSNVIGTIQHIKAIGEITKNEKVLFIVDASQSVGHLQIDVEENNIDLMAFSGHKGLMGPQGTGCLYIRPGVKVENFIQGGTGSNSMSIEQPDLLPDKFESGTLNLLGIAGLCEGIRFIKGIGIDRIKAKENKLLNFLIEELKKLNYINIYGISDSQKYSSVLSLNLQGFGCSQVGYLLNKKNIAVRTGFHCASLIHGVLQTSHLGTVRISPGYFNSEHDIENLLNAIISIHNGR